MYGEGEFDDSGGLGLLLHAAHPATDVQDERAPFPTRASRQRGHTNSPEEVTGSLEPVTGLDQENLDTQDTQQGGEHLDAGPALDSLDPLKLAAARGITKSNPGQAKDNLKLNGWKPAKEKPSKKELHYVVLERDSTLRPAHWAVEKMVKKLLESGDRGCPIPTGSGIGCSTAPFWRACASNYRHY